MGGVAGLQSPRHLPDLKEERNKSSTQLEPTLPACAGKSDSASAGSGSVRGKQLPLDDGDVAHQDLSTSPLFDH